MREMNRNAAWAAALVEELGRAGVREAVISPGSRSAPLAIAFAAHPDIRDRSILDERSAGFFALGLARARRAPVALVCTSGTAAANYLAAVIEAHYSRVPLVVLTADRPPELRDCGAGQTIDQAKLFGSYVRWYAEIATPAPEAALLRWLRAVACRAVDAAMAPEPGPVHLNLPLREPLAPLSVPADRTALTDLEPLARTGRGASPMVRVSRADPPMIDARDVDALGERLAGERRGWIVAGPLDAPPAFAQALGRLSHELGWPILGEPLSQLRSGPHDRNFLVEAHPAVLRVESFVRAHAPRVVLRFGAMPTAKAYAQIFETHRDVEQIVVDPWGWSDPTALAGDIVRADPVRLAIALAEARNGDEARVEWSYAARWVEAGGTARATIDARLDQEPRLTEPSAVRAVQGRLPEGATVMLASSMPVRDADLCWPSSPKHVRFVSNRGANGIDGTLACAIGTAEGCNGPTVLLAGDLAFVHDAGALAIAAASRANLTVVVLDNDGGGIFEMLPVAGTIERDTFERHFGTPHGLDLAAISRAYGVPCVDVSTARELDRALEASLERPGVEVIRVASARGANARLHGDLFAAVAAALGSRS